jgi:hypothetical protein
MFSDSKRPGPKPGRSKALEDRLRKLESIVESLNLEEMSNSDSREDEHNMALSSVRIPQTTVVPASASSSSNGFLPHVDQARPELEEVFLNSSANYTFMSHDMIRKTISESIFFRNVIYSLASTVAPPNLVLAEFSSKEAMCEAYFKRAESFLRRIFRKPSYHGILGLMGLVVFCTSNVCLMQGQIVPQKRITIIQFLFVFLFL